MISKKIVLFFCCLSVLLSSLTYMVQSSGIRLTTVVTVYPSFDKIQGSSPKIVEQDSKIGNIIVYKNTPDTVMQLIGKFDVPYIRVVSPSGEVLKSDSIVGTGCELQLVDGTKVFDSAKIIVMGDLNGDGKIASADALMALRASAGLLILNECSFYAGNLNSDSRITSAEALKILRYSSGLSTSLS